MDTLYLGNRRVTAKGFNSGYDKLPKRLTSDELTVKVKQLLRGDTEAEEPIILGHLGLIIQIVGRYVSYFPMRADDLLSVATLTLVEAVHKFPEKSVDENITPHIVSQIHGKLSDYLKEEDRVVKVSSDGRKKAVLKAKKEGTSVESQLTRTHSIDYILDNENSRTVNRFIAKVSYFDKNDIEYQEIIDKCNFTRFEMLVYERIIEGDKDTDIARELHFSKQRINQVKQTMINKVKAQLRTFDEKIDELAKHLNGYWSI